jgi:hypothetical protein
MRVGECLVPIAYGKLLAKIDNNPAEFGSHQSAYNTELAYSTVQGSTLQAFRAGLKSPGRHDLITAITIIVEPIYFLTRYYLRGASYPRRRLAQLQGGAPMLCDLVEPAFSPVTLVLEYYSSLLDGTAPRLKLLFGRSYANFEEW